MTKIRDSMKFGFGFGIGSTAGSLLTIAVMALYTIIFTGGGLYLFSNFNKENTEITEELTPLQLVGIIFAILGIFPWLGVIFNAIIYSFIFNLDLI